MSLTLFDLTGRTALITGSSRGLGRAFAEGLAAAGARVILNGVNAARLDQAAADLRDRGFDVLTSAFDVTDEAAIKTAFAQFDAEGVAIDILVNNAGIQFRKPMLELETADWQRVIDANLTSAFVIGREAARRMAARGHGKIINIGSVTSELALHGCQGRHQDADPRHGRGMGGEGHPVQRHRAGLHDHRHERGADRQPRIRRLGKGAHADAALGPTRGIGGNRNLPRLRSLELCLGPDHLCRWRHDFGALT
jgi:methylmalonyl-CoA mutase cobalamin-binding subunit